jgi:hypothetical protein
LISTRVLDIVLIIQMLNLLLRMMLRLLTINEVQALSLSQLVDFSACDTDEEFLGELMGDGLAYS